MDIQPPHASSLDTAITIASRVEDLTLGLSANVLSFPSRRKLYGRYALPEYFPWLVKVQICSTREDTVAYSSRLWSAV